MKSSKIIIGALISVILISFLSSCSFFSSEVNRFGGGELLDNELIESIKHEIFPNGDPTINGESTGNPSQEIIDVRDSEMSQQTETEVHVYTDETEASLESTELITENKATSPETDETTEGQVITDVNGERIKVYWSKGGSVWHLSLSCYHVAKLDTVYSGYIEDAIAAKKEKLCSYCEKKYQD